MFICLSSLYIPWGNMPRWNCSELPKQKNFTLLFQIFRPPFFPSKSGKEKFLFRSAERSGGDGAESYHRAWGVKLKFKAITARWRVEDYELRSKKVRAKDTISPPIYNFRVFGSFARLRLAIHLPRASGSFNLRGFTNPYAICEPFLRNNREAIDNSHAPSAWLYRQSKRSEQSSRILSRPAGREQHLHRATLASANAPASRPNKTFPFNFCSAPPQTPPPKKKER